MLAEAITCAASPLSGNLWKSNLMISLANSLSGLINRLIAIFQSLGCFPTEKFALVSKNEQCACL